MDLPVDGAGPAAGRHPHAIRFHVVRPSGPPARARHEAGAFGAARAAVRLGALARGAGRERAPPWSGGGPPAIIDRSAMSRRLKLLLVGLSGLVLLLVAAALAIPFLFRDRLDALLKAHINASVD